MLFIVFGMEFHLHRMWANPRSAVNPIAVNAFALVAKMCPMILSFLCAHRRFPAIVIDMATNRTPTANE